MHKNTFLTLPATMSAKRVGGRMVAVAEYDKCPRSVELAIVIRAAITNHNIRASSSEQARRNGSERVRCEASGICVCVRDAHAATAQGERERNDRCLQTTFVSCDNFQGKLGA
jgi:hypothetical protein